MKLLDTDTLVYYLSHRQPVEGRFEREKAALCTSVINQAELVYGAYNSARVEHNLKEINALLGQLKILPFEHEALHCYGRIKTDLGREGRIIGECDLMIAGIALANRLVLVTNNLRDFGRIKGLKVENWVQ